VTNSTESKFQEETTQFILTNCLEQPKKSVCKYFIVPWSHPLICQIYIYLLLLAGFHISVVVIHPAAAIAIRD